MIYTRELPASVKGEARVTAARQETLLRELGEAMRCEIVGVFREKPEGDDLLELTAAAAALGPSRLPGALLVLDVARLGGARAAALWESALAEQGTRLVLHRSDPGPDRALSRVLTGRDEIRDRIRAAIKGGTPSVSGVLRRDRLNDLSQDEEQDAVDMIYELHAAGRTAKAIAAALNDAGVPARSAAGWTRYAVGNMLRRKRPRTQSDPAEPDQ